MFSVRWRSYKDDTAKASQDTLKESVKFPFAISS